MLMLLISSNGGQTVIVKGADHPRISNERDALQRYQTRTPIRPLLDEIFEPAKPCGIVLQYLDADALAASSKKKLTKPEIKEVAKMVSTGLDRIA
jgi:hypothetical protein